MIKLVKPENFKLKGSIKIPLSKSVSNRQLIISKLRGEVVNSDLISAAEDTLLLHDLINSNDEVLNCGLAGTTFRFLLAYLSIQPGVTKTLTGNARMIDRPISPLVDALNSLGCEVSYIDKSGFPPLKVKGKAIAGGEVEVDGTMSSQFISALMLIAPTLKNGLKIILRGKQVSESYIDLTKFVLKENGVEVIRHEDSIIIENQKFSPHVLVKQADWSSAAYWYQCVALSENGELLLEGLQMDSGQGDENVKNIFQKFGVKSVDSGNGVLISKSVSVDSTFLELNCSSFPDLVPSIVVTAAALGIEMKISGVAHLAYKESNRILALRKELNKVGINLMINDEVIHLNGKVELLKSVNFMLNTHNDHRIAMSFAPLVVSLGEMLIQNSSVVNKSYPNFWDDFKMFFQLIKN